MSAQEFRSLFCRVIYGHLSLTIVGVVVGILVAVIHGAALSGGVAARNLLPRFPRSRPAGVVLLTVVGIWAFWLVATMDLGEFSGLRRPLMVAIPIAYFLTLKFVEEFLAVRAMGMLLLLLAEPVLEACFLKEPVWRLLLVVLAYVWIIKGMFWIGMPYLMRDQIAWAVQSAGRWRALSAAGAAYGLLILLCALVA